VALAVEVLGLQVLLEGERLHGALAEQHRPQDRLLGLEVLRRRLRWGHAASSSTWRPKASQAKFRSSGCRGRPGRSRPTPPRRRTARTRVPGGQRLAGNGSPTKRPTEPAVGRFIRQKAAKYGKTPIPPDTTRSPNSLQIVKLSSRTARLKIVVSPVRVRVSPPRNPCKQAIFVQRSEAREKAGKGGWPCCRSVVEWPRPRRHSRERDEEYTMRSCTDAILHADRGRSANQGHPDVAVERGGGRSCGVRRTASRQEALRSARAPIGRRVAAVLRRGHQERGDRADHQGGRGHARDVLPALPQEGPPGRRLPARCARHGAGRNAAGARPCPRCR
jgi:hypothetical protein